MDINEIKTIQLSVVEQLQQLHVLEAMQLLKPLVDATADYSLAEQLQQASTSYGYMLQYVLAGADDPHQEQIFNDLVNSLYTLTDKCVIALSQPQSFDLFYSKHKAMAGVQLSQLLQQIETSGHKLQMLEQLDDASKPQAVNESLQRDIERLQVDAFNKTWSTFPTLPDDKSLLLSVFASGKTDVELQCLLVSALLLGLNKFYDESKLNLLLEIYAASNEPEVQVRAITAAIITSLLYPHRVERAAMLPQLIINAKTANPNFETDVHSVLMRLSRSRNTENLTKKLNDELVPDIMKLRSQIKDRLKGGENMIDPNDFEANPEWRELLENSGFSRKMEEINEIQSQGDDVFASTFARLKTFPFFNTLANWFMPFSASSPTARKAMPGESKLLLLLQQAPLLCNSDKYSFLFSLAQVPPQQRTMMTQQFQMQQNMQLEQDAASLPDNGKEARDAMINRYIQDLYRFFKLHSRRTDFNSVFDTSCDFVAMPNLTAYLQDCKILLDIAEFYMKNGFLTEAVRYYKFFIENSEEYDTKILQKIGFAYQSQGMWSAAIKYYNKYALVDSENVWTLSHTAACHKAMKRYDKALECYRRADELKPNNPAVLMNIGHLLVELRREDEALKYYFNVDYLKPNQPKVWRAIAWAAFASGNLEQSHRYYDRIVAGGNATSQDHLNYGHLLLLEHNLKEAVEQYGLALQASGKPMAEFYSWLDNDKQYLLDQGLSPTQISLVGQLVAQQHQERN